MGHLYSKMVNEGIVADEGNIEVNEGADIVADVLGDVVLDEVFEDDVLDEVELDQVVNDVANNVIVFESHGFENVLIHGNNKRRRRPRFACRSMPGAHPRATSARIIAPRSKLP